MTARCDSDLCEPWRAALDDLLSDEGNAEAKLMRQITAAYYMCALELAGACGYSCPLLRPWQQQPPRRGAGDAT